MERGIESFKAAVLKDTQGGNNCFNENGCDHEFNRIVPETNQAIIDMGVKQKCISVSKCFHKYCNKYKWVMDRAAHYAEKTGKTIDEIMQVWETDRSYWYMNYYQDCNQPLLTGDNIIMYDDWVKELKNRFGNDSKQWAFICPACGNTQTIQDFIDLKIEDPKDKVFFSCIGRYTKDKGCDWTLGGLLQINKQTVIKDGRATPVFEMAPERVSSIQNPRLTDAVGQAASTIQP